MNMNDFKQIEQELNIVLPQEYKELVIQNPFKAKKFDNVKKGLITDLKLLLELNIKVRKEGYLYYQWNKNYFIIGSSAENWYSIINIKQKKTIKVYGISPEDQIDGKPMKKKLLGDDMYDYIELKKIVSSCY